MSKTIVANFTESGSTKTGLSAVVSIWKVSDSTKEVDGAAATEISDGFYKYAFTGYEEDTDYVVLFDGSSSLQNYERYHYGFIRNSQLNYVTAVFTESGSPKTGLSPTVRIIQVSDGTEVVTDGEMDEIGSGFYKYNFEDAEEDTDYVFICDGGATLNDYERYIYGSTDVGSLNLEYEICEDIEITVETEVDLEI